ncbi:hypothetical protein Amal_01765 [Acetobacter malorum]|uniref:Uncharacterized protein n=1 Tax=Acetobacter malorum TaxID=178901 RepID=A0A177G9F8_9PROT|nr:hypothetical protein [Acetobacter malorum]OAG75995.1 hypothetical protein Amal_01765 [Acetobacter malorum]
MPDDLRATANLLKQSLYMPQYGAVFKCEPEEVYYVEIIGPKDEHGLKSCFSKDSDPLEAAKKALSLWSNNKFSSYDDIKYIESKKDGVTRYEINGENK